MLHFHLQINNLNKSTAFSICAISIWNTETFHLKLGCRETVCSVHAAEETSKLLNIEVEVPPKP